MRLFSKCHSWWLSVPLAFLLPFALTVSIALTEPADRDNAESRFRKSQFGEIALEEEEARGNPYTISQDRAIAFFKVMDTRVKLLSQGKDAGPAEIPEDAINYLTGVYLYCASNSGICPLILEAILEADIINSRLAGKADCPQMKKFWTQWVRSDMEQRLGYLVKTGFMNTVTDFNTRERPAFIRCQDTVKERISSPGTNQEYFKTRYAKDSRPAVLAVKMATLLQGVKQKVTNVFAATGMSDASSQSAGEEGKKTRK